MSTPVTSTTIDQAELARCLMEESNDGLVIFDPQELVLLDVNPATLRMTRKTRKTLLGQQLTDLLGSDSPELLRELVDSCQTTRIFHSRESFRLIRADRDPLDVNVSVSRLHLKPQTLALLAIRDISKRKQLEADLRRTQHLLELALDDQSSRLEVATERRRATEQQLELQSTFLSTVSHELRTPLNSIVGFTSVLLQGMAGPMNPEQEKQLAMVERSAHHLLLLINDVLDVSKIQSGQMEIKVGPFQLSAAVDSVVKTVSPLAEKKHLTLKVTGLDLAGAITSDQLRVEQILLNLLSNAIKFTSEGTIDVRVTAHPDRYSVVVSDTGVGIHERDLEVIFEPFVQLDDSLARRQEGSGLGLAISSRLAGLLGGEIRVESRPESGSQFELLLPTTYGPVSLN